MRIPNTVAVFQDRADQGLIELGQLQTAPLCVAKAAIDEAQLFPCFTADVLNVGCPSEITRDSHARVAVGRYLLNR